MRRQFSSAVCVCLLTMACDRTPSLFVLPTARSGVSPTPSPTPDPAPAPPAPVPLPDVFAPFQSMEIAVGQTVNGRVPAPPTECVGFRGWPCHYFRFTAPSDGTLLVELTYKQDAQPAGQGVDVSIADPRGREAWADYFQPPVVRARASVTAGTVYQITLWYTFSGLEFELQTSLTPS